MYYIYIPFVLYMGYSIYLYNKNKYKNILFINIIVAIIIQCMVLSIHSSRLNKKKKNNIRFNPEVKIYYINNRYE